MNTRPEHGSTPPVAAPATGGQAAPQRDSARRHPRTARRLAALLALCAGLAAVFAATPAHADGYRYWAFWVQQDDSWSYATQGPSVHRPLDGDVLGFRFSVSEDSADAAKPRTETGFEAICTGTDAKSGTKRIAVALDFGTRADAPEGEQPPGKRTACARVSEDATAADALAATAQPLRYDSAALLCAIDGYPRSGCGEQVPDGGGKNTDTAAPPDPSVTADQANDNADSDDALPSGAGPAIGAAAILVLAAAAVWQTRRRRG